MPQVIEQSLFLFFKKECFLSKVTFDFRLALLVFFFRGPFALFVSASAANGRFFHDDSGTGDDKFGPNLKSI